ncbi:hypothetical protein JCM3765_005331 [Sporobolomyces pararoseus]
MESDSERYRPRSPTSVSQLHKPDPSSSQARSISTSRTVSKDRDVQQEDQQYLPTPTSLPQFQSFQDTNGSARPSVTPTRDSTRQVTFLTAEDGSTVGEEQQIEDQMEAREERTESEPRHVTDGGLPFEIDMDIEIVEDTEQHRQAEDRNRYSQSATTIDSPFSSSHRPVRTQRARYASSESEGSPPRPVSQITASPAAHDDAAPSHKRTFSYVSAATGRTPPALAYSAFESRPTFVASPPLSPRLAPASPDSYFPSLDLPLPSAPLSVDIAQHPLFRSTPLVTEPRSNPNQHRACTHSFESQRASAVRVSGRRNLLEVARESLEGAEASRSSSLRRRSPVLHGDFGDGNRDERERRGGKRRRASTLLPGNSQTSQSSIGSAHQGSQSFAPALGRYPSQVQPVDPILSRPATTTSVTTDSNESLQFRSRHRVGFGLGRGGLSLGRSTLASTAQRLSMDLEPLSQETDERRAVSPPRQAFGTRLPPWWRSTSFAQSTSYRPAPPSLSDNLAVVTSTSVLPTPPLALSASTSSSTFDRSSSLDTFAADAHRHAQYSERLHGRSDQILRQAEETLRSRQALLRNAEESTRQARRLLEEDREDRERERRISRLPDVGGLPEPAELSARPVIGLRIGEGWPAATTTTQAQSPPSARRRRSSIFSSLSPPSSPDEAQSDSLATGGATSRTRQFLTSLRARRPRFSRNSTGNTPSEQSLADTLFGSPGYDVEAEHQAANELNERLLERRRISASLDPPSAELEQDRFSGLWGETLVRTSRSTLRGPNRNQNERWRRGEAPVTESTTPALPSGVVTPLEGPSSSRSTSAMTYPPPIGNNATDLAATSYFSRRDDSPSENRPRSSIRLPLGTPQSGSAASSSRTRLQLDDGEDEETQSQTNAHSRWNPPHSSLMLPSGSEGRRMVFPHPAHAAGMSDSLEAAEEGGLASTTEGRNRRWLGSFGPDHLEQAVRFSINLDLSECFELKFFLSGRMNSQNPHPSSTPFDNLPLPLTTTSTADAYAMFPSDSAANSRIAPSNSIGEAESSNQTLRRRLNALEGATFPSLEQSSQGSVDAVTDRLAQHRVERLASLRRERTFMRSLLGGSDDLSNVGPSNQTDRSLWRERTRDSLDLERERRSAQSAATPGPSSPPRSPGFRRRALGDFFRGFGHGGRLISIFDEEFGAFFGREAVALDSRNYVEDDDFDASYEGLLRLSAQIGDAKPKGVPQEAIAQLRTFPYSQWPYIERSSSSVIASTSARTIEGEEKPQFARKNVDKEARCAICLCDYEEDDQVSLAICSHGFHSDCLKSWLSTNGSCPVCRRDHTS